MSGAHESPSPWLSNRVYDVTKFVAQILLPALGTLYAGIAVIWGVPDSEQVVSTIVAVDTFLGVLLGISSAQHAASDSAHDGVIQISTTPQGGKLHQLVLNGDPEKISEKKQITFKVVEEQVSPTPGDLPQVPPMG